MEAIESIDLFSPQRHERPSPLAVLLAWIYVGLRIVHSVWQAMVNIVSVRFLLFLAYSFALIALAILALIATLGGPA